VSDFKILPSRPGFPAPARRDGAVVDGEEITRTELGGDKAVIHGRTATCDYVVIAASSPPPRPLQVSRWAETDEDLEAEATEAQTVQVRRR